MSDELDLRPILDKENGSDSQGEPCSEEYGFCVREKCLSGPPRAISWCSVFQYFAQMVGTYQVRLGVLLLVLELI